MATAAPAVVPAGRVPGPPELLPGRPDAIVDLQRDDGAAVVGATWRFADARVREVGFVELGGPGSADPLGPGTVPNRTYDVEPRAEAVDFDDSGWTVLSPADTTRRLSRGRVCFCWYRTAVTIPERFGELDATGTTVVFEVVVDDYAEVWVDGALPAALGTSGGPVVGGFNVPNRVVLTQDARPGQTFQLAVFGINGPISAAPANYIWMRSATLDVYAPGRASAREDVAFGVERHAAALDDVVPPGASLERVAGGFEFTEGPVWSPDGALLFSSPNTNAIYRWDPVGSVGVFRPKSGYTGLDVGRFEQPGSNGLAFDPEGRLVVCQHGNRRVVRVEPHGNLTVLADAYGGRRLNSPNDVVVRRDGTTFFTDPPFGLPATFDDPAKELPFSGVFAARDGEVRLLTDELAGPNGLALAADDDRVLYVGDWDLGHKAVMRYVVDDDLRVASSSVLCDLTGEAGEDAIDGLAVDPATGAVLACGPGGVWVIAPDGERLGLLRLPEAPHNLTWGDADGRTLYVAALSSIYRLRRPR